MKKIARYYPLVLFFLFLFGFSLLDVLTPAKEYSELENRNLAQFPKFTVRSLISGAYTTAIENNINDQFIMRDSWIGLKSFGETALGKTENNGVVFGADGYLFEKLTEVDNAQIERNLENIRRFAAAHPEQNIAMTIVANSYAITPERLPQGLELVDQDAMIDRAHSRLSDFGIAVWDARPILKEHGDEPLFYRTDHHWTTRGAYLAYAGFARAQGLEPADYNALALHEEPDFYGTLYSKSKLYSALPDTITWYDVPGVSVEIDGSAKNGVYDFEKFKTRDKYAAFLHSNNALTILRRQTAGEQPTRILLIKDSYGNCYAPLLTFSYDEVYVVDLRFYREMDKLLAETSFDVVYLLYNFTSFAQDTNFHQLTPAPAQ